jgi:hypothetical protein
MLIDDADRWGRRAAEAARRCKISMTTKHDGDAEGRRGLQYARHARQSVFSYDARTISFFAEFTT